MASELLDERPPLACQGAPRGDWDLEELFRDREASRWRGVCLQAARERGFGSSSLGDTLAGWLTRTRDDGTVIDEWIRGDGCAGDRRASSGSAAPVPSRSFSWAPCPLSWRVALGRHGWQIQRTIYSQEQLRQAVPLSQNRDKSMVQLMSPSLPSSDQSWADAETMSLLSAHFLLLITQFRRLCKP